MRRNYHRREKLVNKSRVDPLTFLPTLSHLDPKLTRFLSGQ